LSDQRPEFPPYFKWAALVFLITWFAILASAFGLNIFPRTPDFERTGQFGDSFGVLNAIMASFAAISAFAAYQAQREEIDRLRATEGEREYFAYKRDFENTFFNLLNLFRETVKEIIAEPFHSSHAYHGRDAIGQILRNLRRRFHENQSDQSEHFTMKITYSQIYAIYRDDLGHYFRIFYHTLRYIDESNLVDKMVYIRLLRATLSNTEITIIGLNCIYGGGQLKLKPLVEKYALLHNISSEFAEKWELTTRFDPTAFGDRIVSADGKLGS
jgi:Putative phage abortive infection protein